MLQCLVTIIADTSYHDQSWGQWCQVSTPVISWSPAEWAEQPPVRVDNEDMWEREFIDSTTVLVSCDQWLVSREWDKYHCQARHQLKYISEIISLARVGVLLWCPWSYKMIMFITSEEDIHILLLSLVLDEVISYHKPIFYYSTYFLRLPPKTKRNKLQIFDHHLPSK